MSCPLNMKSEPWGRVSPPAKELVRKMLTRDPRRRLTADQVWSQAAGLGEYHQQRHMPHPHQPLCASHACASVSAVAQ